MLDLHLTMSNSMNYMKAATAYINLEALQHNLQRVKQQAPESKIMAVVKANGYGHGCAISHVTPSGGCLWRGAQLKRLYSCAPVA